MNVKTKLFRPKEYFKPTTLAEAIKLLSKYGETAQAIAGGTDILVEKDHEVEVLIDITALGLDYIKPDNQGVKIGAATTHANIEAASALSKRPYGVLAQAAHSIGTPQIRNVATIGGNICHALPSADSAPPLLALDATIKIAGSARERSIDINNFFLDPKKTALNRTELLTEILLPTFPPRTEAVFIKRGRVATGDLAIANIAVRLTLSTDNVCQEVRIALGAVAPVPLRAKKAEEMLQGEKPQDELLGKVADQVVQEISPISDVRSSAEYRRILSRVLVERALKEVVARLL